VGRRACYSFITVSRNLMSRGLSVLLAFGSWTGARCLRIGRGGFGHVVRVEDDSGECRPIIYTRVKLVHSPGVAEGLGI